MSNPFNPSFGKVPPVFLDRDKEIDNVVEGLKDNNSPWQTTMISGVRGVGKTAFLADVCRKLEEDKSWLVIDVPSNGKVMESLVQLASEKSASLLEKAGDSLSGVSVSVLGLGVGYSNSKETINYQNELEKILKKLKDKKMRLLVAIDEVLANEEICSFASIYQIMIRKDYPISLIMTGLPKAISELQNNEALTFLLRSQRITLPFLNEVSVQYSYKNIFDQADREIPLDVLKRMTSLTRGYSYAFQLLGYYVWDSEEKAVSNETIDSIMDKYKEGLFRNAYFKIFEELSKMDQNFLLAMAKSENEYVSMKEMVDELNKDNNYLATYRRRLMEAGIINSPSYGHVEFALPLFKDYLVEFKF